MRFIKVFTSIIIKCVLASFLLMSCSSNESVELVKTIEKTDVEIYKNALSLSIKGKHKKAALEFDSLNLNHPYSSLNTKAEIMTAYSLYENNQIKKAIIKLNTFLEMNPADELSPYAQYLLAMCYYIQISSQGRDVSLTKKALNQLKIIVSKYPNSKYAKDAKLKIQFINNSLATNELSVGVFYLKNNFPIAAIKRFKTVITRYKNTNVVPETLYRLCEGLMMIGLLEEAKKSKALLIYNFPKNKWSELSKKLIDGDTANIEDREMFSSIKNFIKIIFD